MSAHSARPVIEPGLAVLALGLVSALAWGSGDFGGGLLSRRAPLFGVVLLTQGTGLVAAVILAIARGEPVPAGQDLAWSVLGGLTGVIGITALYQGLAVGRMAVVAPTTGVLAALVPVIVGFALEGVPGTPVLAGIGAALIAVVLVTRAPGHPDGRPSGVVYGLVAGLAIGAFNVFAGQLSSAGAFGPLALIRLSQGLALATVVVLRRSHWRVDRALIPRVAVVGMLDMTGNAAFILAAQGGQLAIAAVLSSLYPVVTVLLAIAFLRERLTRSHLAGIVLTGLAIALIGAGSGPA